MSNPSEETGTSKRSRIFRGKGAQHRSNLKKRARRNQSTGDITQCVPDQSGTQSTGENTNSGRKIPRWLRLLKMTSISATTTITLDGLKSENTSHQHNRQGPPASPLQQRQQPQQEVQSFLGNLGIGAYVGEEENAFVNSDTSEDINVLQVNKSNRPISKSMINLSSISLWAPKRKSSDQTNEPEATVIDVIEQYSCSSSSHVSCMSNASSSSPPPIPRPPSTPSFHRFKQKASVSEKMSTTTSATSMTMQPTMKKVLNQFKQTGLYESMPLILKTVIHQTSMSNITSVKYSILKGFTSSNTTPKPSTNTITRNSSRNQSDDNIEELNRIICYPAWMIVNDEKLKLDTTYTFYRISNYLKELYIAESWLDNLLVNDISQSRSHSPVRQPTDYRSRRTRNENNLLISQKIQKRTCSEQRYEETQLIAGLWDRKEMDLIQKLIRRAISSIELKKSIKQIDGEESCPSEMSAFIFRNSSTEMNLPIALRSFLPETEVTIGNKEMNSWKKIYAEEVVNIIKLPRFPTEQAITRETIHQSQESTIFLCSDHIVLTQWPLDPQSFLSTGDLAHIIPLYEVWCDTLKPEALFSRSTSVTKSTGINKGSHSQKHMKTSEIDIDNAKCNVSSSSGISTASLEDAESNSPSIDNNQSLDNEIKIRVTESSSTNETSVSTDTSLLLLVGRPLTENWAIRFSNNSLCEKWEHMINESIKRNQQIFEGKTINVKVINQIIPNHQVIYKYHNVPIHMTANHLKEKALEALNTNVGNTNAELFLRYTESNGEEREILMYGPEIPFLIAFSSVQMNHTSSPLFQQNNSVTATTTTVISSNSNPNSPDASYSPQGKDILDLMKKVSSTSPQSDVRINDSDYIIPRDQVKVSFVLRPREKSSTEDHQTHQTVKSDDITTKPVEYTKQERGRSKSKARGRRGGVGGGGGDHTGDKQNSLMTKSSLFLDNSMSTSKQTSLPLRAAISTSALQINTAQDTQCGQIFGCLPEQVWPDSQLPESLVNLFAIVYYNGVDIEGIFRRTAVHSQIELMRARVDENIQAITPNNCNPILASCVLKRFFYEIPGHLLIDSKWDEWASLTGINSSTERLQLIEKLVRSLPKVNQTLLALLIYLLAHIRDNEETNRMSARNLAVVWGPNLIQRPNSPLALSDSKIATQIVTYLLEPPVTNFLLETSNARNELNQHFTNIWGNLKGTTGISHTAKTVGNTKMFSAITGTDSSEDDKSSKVDSGVQSEQRTEDSTHKSLKTDTEIKHPSRRGHSVASVPPHISPLESDNLLNSEKFYSPLLKGHDLHESTANTSTVSIDSRSSLSLTSSLSNSSVMTRRGVGRINRKKQSMLSQLALPDQTGPPVAIKQTTSSSDATTSDLRGIKRVRATSTVVQPTSSSPMAMTTTTTTAVATVAEAIGKLKRTSVLHRSRNTSCPPSRDTGQQKMSTPYPLPKYQVDLEAPPVPPKLQQSMQLTYQGVRCKQASIATNANSLKANQNHQIKFTKNSQYSEREPSPPVPKKTFHRRFRLQKTTSEIPDVSLFTDSCYTKEMKSNNSNTYRRRNSMESQMNNSRLPNETISNELSINSTKTDESSAPIKIISVSSSSNNHNNVGDNNKENISHRSHRHSYAHSIGDNPGGNNLTAKYTKLLQASTDHRTRNSIPQSESDMSVTSTDSSSLSFSSSSLSSLRKHSRRKETDLSGIPSPVVHRPEFSKQGFIVNPQRKSSCIIHRMISPQQFGVYKNVDSQAEQYATGLPSFASSSLSSSSSPTSFSSSDIGYATSQHENQESIVEIDSIAYGTPVSRMSSHASTISSGSATVISTSTEK